MVELLSQGFPGERAQCRRERSTVNALTLLGKPARPNKTGVSLLATCSSPRFLHFIVSAQFVCPHCERLVPMLVTSIESQSVVLTCSKCCQTHRETLSSALTETPRTSVSAVTAVTPVVTIRSGSLESSATASNVVSLRTTSTEALERAAKASRADPFEVPSGFCPKCVSKRSAGDSSCPFCGLDFTKYDPDSVRPPSWLKEPWRELLLTWNNETEHAHVRNLATQSNGLPELGRAYRIRLADFPDDPFALRGRDDLVRQAATAVNYKPLAEGDDSTPMWKYVAAFLMLMFALIASFYILKFVAASPA